MDFSEFVQKNNLADLIVGGIDLVGFVGQETQLQEQKDYAGGDVDMYEVRKKIQNAAEQLKRLEKLLSILTEQPRQVRIDTKYKKIGFALDDPYSMSHELQTRKHFHTIMIVKKEAARSCVELLKPGINQMTDKVKRNREALGRLSQVCNRSRIQSGGLLMQRCSSVFPFDCRKKDLFLNLLITPTEHEKKDLSQLPNNGVLSFIPVNFVEDRFELNLEFITETITFLNTHSLTITVKERNSDTPLVETCFFTDPITSETTDENIQNLRQRILEFQAFRKLSASLLQNNVAHHTIPDGFAVELYGYEVCVSYSEITEAERLLGQGSNDFDFTTLMLLYASRVDLFGNAVLSLLFCGKLAINQLVSWRIHFSRVFRFVPVAYPPAEYIVFREPNSIYESLASLAKLSFQNDGVLVSIRNKEYVKIPHRDLISFLESLCTKYF